MNDPDWLLPIIQAVDRGEPVGVSGIPADADVWGVDSVDVAIARHFGSIEIALTKAPPMNAGLLGARGPLGWGLAIGCVSSVRRALERAEMLLDDPHAELRTPCDTFLDDWGAHLTALTLSALAERPDFHGIMWQPFGTTARPVVDKAGRRIDGLPLWALALDGRIEGSMVVYRPNRMHTAQWVCAAILRLWDQA